MTSSQPIFTREADGRKYYTFDTHSLLDFVKDQEYVVEAEIHYGQIVFTHWFSYEDHNDVYNHTGIDSADDIVTTQEILKLYPKTHWIVWLDTLCSESEMLADNKEEE